MICGVFVFIFLIDSCLTETSSAQVAGMTGYFFVLYFFFHFHFALMQNETKDQDLLLFLLNSTFYFIFEPRPQALWVL
tara:strand:+ start:35347 stop:35580 length:234 start_codon:yes stop_codon:yes gene_type:complete